jgi:hypothetical protein
MLLADYADDIFVLNLFYMWSDPIDHLINSIIFSFSKDYFITDT